MPQSNPPLSEFQLLQTDKRAEIIAAKVVSEMKLHLVTMATFNKNKFRVDMQLLFVFGIASFALGMKIWAAVSPRFLV